MKRAAKLLYVVNDAGFFLSHRLSVARAAAGAGYDVHVATPKSREVNRIKNNGFTFHAIPLSRWGGKPYQELATLVALFRLYQALRPDIIHHVTIKPVLYGGMMARLAGISAVVSAPPGLGYVFVARGFMAALRRAFVKRCYAAAMQHPNIRLICQNPDDLAQFVENRLVCPESVVLIKGSGVDMDRFFPEPESRETPLVIFPSRMLWDKGVQEFIEAARRLRVRGVRARFALVGDSELGNPGAVPPHQLAAWHREGVVEWWGWREDMQKVFAGAHIVCLPSAYGEGVPKVLIEAAACGRAIVTTDSPGCREIVLDGDNGLLVPVRDSRALAGALARLIADGDLRKQMGVRGRAIAEKEFSLRRVVDETLAVYRDLLV